MTPDQISDVSREAVMTLLIVGGPLMMVALVVGILVALFQALTSIQEVTLTFVPKILAVFLVMIVVMPFMASRIGSFTQDLFARMTVNPTPEAAAGVEQTAP
ncbi:MAG: flagellar biosynthesis protein FliQ [Pseudomonadaceae bacterium]|nr:flagellar biosynthesis protein FliQ [Pseudomonadaceae bacterium]